jgi:hypothetical protein
MSTASDGIRRILRYADVLVSRSKNVCRDQKHGGKDSILSSGFLY